MHNSDIIITFVIIKDINMINTNTTYCDINKNHNYTTTITPIIDIDRVNSCISINISK